jgi:hypothetical protein
MNKIFIIYEKSWICKRLVDEWICKNKEIYTDNIDEAGIIWLMSYFMYKQIPKDKIKNKTVVTTIHHIVPNKWNKMKDQIREIDNLTTYYHSICDITTQVLQTYTRKYIITCPFWENFDIWKKSTLDKKNIKENLDIPINKFLIGSFQRDTEGNSIKNKRYEPKLEKGPDILFDVIKDINKTKQVCVILGGFRRDYIIKKLNEVKIPYKLFENVDQNIINNIYQCLDLYIVGSRIEGGPRSIYECAITKCPIISTKVGIAYNILASKSIFSQKDYMTYKHIEPDVNIAFENVQKYNMNNYMDTFNYSVFFNKNS